MADLVSTVKLIYKAFTKIKEVLKTLNQNNEDVRNMEQLVDTWTQILLPLEKKTMMLEDRGISSAVKCLWESLERAQAQILMDTNSNRVSVVINAEDKANKLRRLREEISQKIVTLTAAILTYNAVCAESRQTTSPSQASSCPRMSFILGMQSMGVPEAPSQLHKITRASNSVRSLRYSKNSNRTLDVHPLELRFPFETNKKIQCPVTLTNRTENYVGVWITRICPTTHAQFTCPSSKTLDPYSSLVMPVTMKQHRQHPEPYTCKFEVLMVVVWSKIHLQNLTSIIDGNLNMDKHGVNPQLVHILEQAEKLHGEVHRAMLTTVICDQENCPIISISTEDMEDMAAITSIDVHPTRPWILTSHEGGKISIWNYQTQECMKTFQVTKERARGAFTTIENYLTFVSKKNYLTCPYGIPHRVYSAKLIARKCLLAAGDGAGNVHVCSLTNGTTVKKVKRFSAYSAKPVDALAVHPSKPYLLSSSTYDGKIKLWDWDNNWKKIQEFVTNTGGVRSLTFNSRDTDTFACVAINRNAKLFDQGVSDEYEESTKLQVWNIRDQSSGLTNNRLPGRHSADFFFTQSHQHRFMVTSGPPEKCAHESTASCSEIWDLQKSEVVHTLYVSGNSKTIGVGCHPTLPILVTTSDDGTICLWDARTYRLEKMVQTEYKSSREGFVFTEGTNDSRTRIVLRFKSMLAIMGVEICECQGSTSGLVVGAIYEMP